MILDDLDIEIEDDDGTGVRNGTIRYPGGIVLFYVTDNRIVNFIGRLSPWVSANDAAIEEMILKLV